MQRNYPITDPVNVIGAAIAGPAAAIRLARMGYPVTVHDQRNEPDLFSAGILGITPSNWEMLIRQGVNVEEHSLDNQFRDYSMPVSVSSPFRYIAWTDLHNSLVEVARSAGAEFKFGSRIASPESAPGMVIDATGVAGAARRNLPHVYSGFTIYRGLSEIDIPDPFIAFHGIAGSYFTIGHTPYGSFWAYFTRRPQPVKFTTVEAQMPPSEYKKLPAEFREIVRRTPRVAKTPMSDWKVPDTMYRDDFRYIAIGDVNGPVRPVTTSGANLAIMDGFNVDRLMSPYTAPAVSADLLRRRAYDLLLGIELEGPEIGGSIEDESYEAHHSRLFGGGYE